MHINCPWGQEINQNPKKNKLTHPRMVLAQLLTYFSNTSQREKPRSLCFPSSEHA